MQPTISGKQLIGYSESATGKESFRSTDPKTGESTTWIISEADNSEIDRAANLAESAFLPYSKLPGKRRAEFLNAVANELESRRDTLVQIFTRESGLPEGRANGELSRTTGQLRAFADLAKEGSWIQARIDTAAPERKPAPKPDIRKCLVPLGPVVVFGASNFPFAFSTAGGDTASALAAGCPVIVKGHPMHPGTGEQVARALLAAASEAGMPEGVFSYLHGASRNLGERLVGHPAIKAVGFTGSRAGGLALAELAAQREVPIPFFAEMGSVNPVVLLPSALASDAGWAQSLAGSVTLGVGQFCTNPGLLFGLAGPELEDFAGRLAREVEEKPSSCMLHPDIAHNYRDLRQSMEGQEGVRFLNQGDIPGEPNEVPATVALVSGRNFAATRKLQEEVFGPFTLVVACKDIEELQQILRDLEGQLTGTLLGNEREFGENPALIDILREKTGRLLFNGVPTGVEVCPSMHHGGPYPSTTDSRFTSVGTDAIYRWVRPVCLQNCPQSLLPEPLQDANPQQIWRMVDGNWTDDIIMTL